MIRLDQLASAGLSDAEKIDALASGLESMAQLLHRTRLGGSTAEIDARFDADGMVLVPVPEHALSCPLHGHQVRGEIPYAHRHPGGYGLHGHDQPGDRP
jgi:hypothetical protein